MTTNKRNMSSAELEQEVLAKIGEFSDKNLALAQKLHTIIMEAAPSLHPRLWYGMPGYAKTKDSAVICFFREDEKYMTFGFTESVNVAPSHDSQDLLVPCAWYFTDLNDATEQKIAKIITQITTH